MMNLNINKKACMNYTKIFISIFFCCSILFSVNAKPIKDTIINIDAIQGLQYDIVRFKVSPNSRVRLAFFNKDDMPHNFVITKPGARMKVVEKALEDLSSSSDNNYVPDIEEVLWSIPILNPNESKRLFFTAPEEEGVYPYVCTLPGHGTLMYGAMYVTNEELPDLETDTNIPEKRRNINSHKDNEYTYNQVYRTLMPKSSAAAIAVNLNNGVSICWETTTCNLLYAWKGSFIDNSKLWQGHNDATSKINGNIIYENDSKFTFHLDFYHNIPHVKYIGYKIENDLPQFNYSINGVEVYESIYFKKNDNKIYRKFTISSRERY